MTKEYKPERNHFDAIELNSSLLELREDLAEKVHDAYVASRLAEGWTLGPERDDAKKTNPTLIPYDELSEIEKDYDRRTAETTLKMILALGYQIVDPEIEVKRKEMVLEEVARRLAEEASSLRLLREIWAARDEWGSEVPTVQKLVAMALELGELGLVYEIGREGLELGPGNAQLAQQVALAHVHDGHHDRAREIIAPILEEELLAGLEAWQRGEVLAVMGRIHKEIFRQTSDPADLELAIQAYRRAFDEGSRDSYPRINEASLRLVAGQQDEARKLAEEVLGLVGEPSDAWEHATQAEAFLVLGDLGASCAAYRKALAENPSWRAGARMREQALWLCESKEEAGGSDSAMAAAGQIREAFADLPSIVIYGGPMSGEGNFSQDGSDAVAERLSEALDRLNPAVLYGSGKCGADLLILEAAGGHVERQIVLPGPEKAFVETAVSSGGEGWEARFHAQISQASGDALQISRHDPGENHIAHAYGQEVVIGLARLRARRLGLETKALVLWDPESDGGESGTRNLVGRCEEAGIPVELVSPRNDAERDQERRPASRDQRGYNIRGTRTGSGEQVVKAMLFADVKGFSKLGEEQIVPFQNEYMRVVSAIIDEGNAGPVVTNTWGDAIYMVFDRVLDAAQFALQMKEKLSLVDRKKLGLPEDLAIRTALHAGPVFALVDPVTRFFTYSGSHVTYTARLEPVTEPGQIYVSEQFAALLELSPGREDVALFYVGHKQAAKGYGEVSLYRLERA